MHKGYLKSDGKSQSITHNKADATAMWIMDAEYYVKSQKKGTIEKVDKSLPDRVGRNYIVTFDKKMKKGGMAKSEAPKGKSIVKKEKKTKEPKIVRGFFDDEPYEYNKGGEFGKPMKMYRVKVEGEGKNAKIYRENDEGKYVFSKESTEAYLKKKGYMAKGGMTEHGLMINDHILGGVGNKVVGKNTFNRHYFVTDLNKGTRQEKGTYAEGGYMKKGGKTDEKPKTPKDKKMKTKEPKIVRGYFDDEPYEYGGGGAIYKGDKVKIKGSNKTMVVKNISKGKKGYVEFSGDGGTFLKGDIEKYAEGGEIGKELMGGQPFSEPKPSGAILLEVRSRGKEIIVTEDGGKTKERYVKSNGFSGYTLRYKGNQYEFTDTLMANGGSISSWNYEIGGL